MPRQHCSTDTQLFVPCEQGLCPPLCRFAAPWADPLKSLGSHFCGRFHLVSKGPWGAVGHGVIPQSPTLRVTCKLPWRESWAQPPNRLSLFHCLRDRGVFSQLTCLQVERCGKVRDKNGLYRVRAFLYRKEGNTSVGFYFSPSSSKNTKRLCS